jgi:DNA-binding protein H-NS
MAVARRDAGTPAAPPPPTSLRPYLRFRGLPGAARAVVRDALDADESFRLRVVEQAADALDGDAVDATSRWFLTRPDGWRADLDAAVDAAVDRAERHAAERDEGSARRRVEQLEAAVARLRDELLAAEHEVARLGETLEREQAHGRGLAREVADGRALRDRLEDERATAVRQLAEARTLAESRLDERRAARRDAEAARSEAEELRARVEELTAAAGTAASAGAADRGPAPDASPDASRAASPAGAPAPGPVGDPAAPPPGMLADAASALVRAAGAATALGAELAAVAAALRSSGPAGGPGGPGVRSGPAVGRSGPTGGSGPAGGGAGRDVAVPGDGPARSTARRPRVRLRRGAVDGTPEAARQHLSAPGVVVLVDGYNVSMEAWPELPAAPQREALLTCLTDVQRRWGPEVHVVFDGEAEGGRPAVTAPLEVRVHFSPLDVEADDVILDMVERIDADRPVLVVSSDHRVRDGARRLGASVLGAAELRAVWRP